MFTRRQFLAGVIPGLALVTGGISVAGYREGGCPLSSSGYCVGPCSALRDQDGDLFCDRIGAPVQAAPTLASQQEPAEADSFGKAQAIEPREMPDPQDSPAVQPTSVQAPLKEAQPKQLLAKPTAQPRPARSTPAPRAELVVLCPFGLVNDRYPGRCRRYIDRNGDGICDLSEPRPAGQANP